MSWLFLCYRLSIDKEKYEKVKIFFFMCQLFLIICYYLNISSEWAWNFCHVLLWENIFLPAHWIVCRQQNRGFLRAKILILLSNPNISNPKNNLPLCCVFAKVLLAYIVRLYTFMGQIWMSNFRPFPQQAIVLKLCTHAKVRWQFNNQKEYSN